jgi:hypothetical protein
MSTSSRHDSEFWKRKLAAFLHDTPTKCLNIPEHREKSRSAMLRAGFTEEEVNAYDHQADWAAAAADRYPFPESRAAGLTCAFDGHRNRFHHPLDGQQQLGFTPITSDALGTETEQVCQPLLETGQPDDPDFWRNRFFAHWRLWCRDAREKDYRLAFLPADTRIPDHTIWNHMQVVSALAGANTDGGPAFLRLQIGGVQQFIGQARNTRDLWSGSYLLSWLMVAGLKDLTSRIGPDAVIFPNLLGQPLFDLHWKTDLWENLTANGRDHAWAGFNHSSPAQLTPNFPNVFLALVPANQADCLGKSTAEAIRKELKSIAARVWDHALESGILIAGDQPRFNSQIDRFLTIAWQAEPWPADQKPNDGTGLAAACALAKGTPSDSPLADAAKGVAAIRKMAEQDMPLKDRDRRYYTDDTKTKLNNAGLAWSILVAHQQAQLDAVRQTHVFPAAAEGGWSIGSHNTKDALIGRDEALVSGSELAARVKAAGSYWPKLFKKNDPTAALTLLKRTWHIAYLHAVWQFPLEAFKMPNTRGIAAHKPDTNLDDDLESEDLAEIPASQKYFAVLALDGDEIGKWVSGAKTPLIANQLAHYADGSGHLTEGSLPYFKHQGMDDLLASRRALSPSYHLQFSETLSAFALHCARPIVEAFDGRLIYAGGDDVVALLPADKALRCAEALRAAFQGAEQLRTLLADTSAAEHFTSPAPGFLACADACDQHGRGTPIPFIVPGPAAEVSVGIAIAHFKAPLQDVVRAAQAAEKRAKGALGRTAFSLRLMKHSGEMLDWGSKWTGGGLPLYRAIAHALDSDQLSGKFPHRLCEVLTPFINRTEAITDLAGFPIAEVIRREFSRLLLQHEGKSLDRAPLVAALEAYLHTTSGDQAAPSAVASDLVQLATAVAFAHRTR